MVDDVVVEGTPVGFPKALKNRAVSRDELLIYVDEVLSICFEKIHLKNTTNSERQGWVRLINGAISCATPLLRDSELADLQKQIDEIRARLHIDAPV